MKQAVFFVFFVFVTTSFWSQIELINTGTSDRLRLSIIDKKIIIYGNQTYLSRSNDECNSLSLLSMPEMGAFKSLERVDTSLFFMSSTSAISQGKIYKSTDGGHNWIVKYSSTSHRPYGISFFNTNEGIAFIGFYQKIRTMNSGDTWTNESFTGYGITAKKIQGDSSIYVGLDDGPIGYSKNRGQTWSFWAGFSTQNHISDFFFLNADTGFATTGKGNFGPYLALCPNTQTNTWQIKTIPIYAANGIYFKNAAEGYVVGKLNDTIGTILKTNDLGTTWQRFKTGIKTELVDIKPLNDSIYLISGTNGVLFKWNSKQTVFTGVLEYSLTKLQLNLFPNPVKDKLNLQFENHQKINALAISNTLGEELYIEKSFETFKVDNTYAVDVGFLNKGIYFLKVSTEYGQGLFKFIKE